MAKNEEIIIDDSNESWQAVIQFHEKVADLCFYRKSDGGMIQGYVDDTLGEDCIPTGINDLDVLPDDGSFIIDFHEYSDEQAQAVKQSLIDYLTKLYEDNKNKFSKNIRKDIKAYEKAVTERDKPDTIYPYCQSCGRPLHNTKSDDYVPYGTEADGTKSRAYCCICFDNGNFTEDLTIEKMAEKCVTVGYANKYFTINDKEQFLKSSLFNLKRWKKEYK